VAVSEQHFAFIELTKSKLEQNTASIVPVKIVESWAFKGYHQQEFYCTENSTRLDKTTHI
jgi:hypothetical protein